jgi:uncharacterized membrane protein YqjE
MSEQQAGPAGASTAELLARVGDQISRLVRDEVALARLEMTAKAKRAGTGAALLGGALVLAGCGVAVLVATLVLLLALVMPAWLAALIVTVALFAVAGLLALLGRGAMRRAGSPMPVEAIDSVKTDLNAVTGAIQARRNGASQANQLNGKGTA